MLRVKLPVVDRTQPQSNKFAKGVENKDTGDSKLNYSPDINVNVSNVQCKMVYGKKGQHAHAKHFI